MVRSFSTENLEWKPVRPDITRGVQGKTLLEGATKIVLTRVGPGGRFAPHRDEYGHLFYFLSGRGKVLVEQREFEAVPGLIIEISAGEEHAYENSGKDDLILISVNTYHKQAE